MLSVTTTTTEDYVEAKLVGRLDVKAAKEADSTFAEIAAEGKDVVLDFAELSYIASAGLRALKRLRTSLRENGKTLAVKNVQENVMEILELTGFAAMLSFV